MRERAKVVAVHGERATVAIRRTSMCDSCGKCGAAKLNPEQDFKMSVINTAGARPGDIVELEMDPRNVLLAAFMVYGLPILLAVLGYIVGSFVGSTISAGREVSGIIGGMLFFTSAFLLLYLSNKRFERSGRFIPRIVRVHRID